MDSVNIRFREFGDQSAAIVIGKNDEKVTSFKFTNEGKNSIMKVMKDGAGFSLLPEQEEMFASDFHSYYNVQGFTVIFEPINLKPIDTITGERPDLGDEDVIHKGRLTEQYLTL